MPVTFQQGLYIYRSKGCPYKCHSHKSDHSADNAQQNLSR